MLDLNPVAIGREKCCGVANWPIILEVEAPSGKEIRGVELRRCSGGFLFTEIGV